MPLRAVVDVRVAAPGLRVVGVARLGGAALDVDAAVDARVGPLCGALEVAPVVAVALVVGTVDARRLVVIGINVVARVVRVAVPIMDMRRCV